MEGLEISEILLSKLENEVTIGAEYYSPNFLISFKSLISSGMEIRRLDQCCSLITDGDHGSADYVENGVKFILSEAVKNGWIDENSCRQISVKHANTLNRSMLKKNDVLVTKTGIYFGRSAVVTEEFVGANTIAHVGVLRLKNGINPYYLSTFFNSQYGYSQLRRRGIKATRPEIKLIEFQDISIAIPSPQFQTRIEKIVLNSQVKYKESTSTYNKGEKLLLDALGLADFSLSTEQVNIKSYKDSFAATGRLDAEFYQPKYEELVASVKHLQHRPLIDFIVDYSTGYPYKSEDYIESGVPLIRINNIKKGFLDLLNTSYLPVEQMKISPNDIAIEGDILLSMSGTIGNTCVIPRGVTALINQRIMRFTPKNYKPLALMLMLNSIVGELQLERVGTGGVQTNISSNDINKIIIPVLPDEKQNQITNFIQQYFTLKAESERLLYVAKRAVELAIEQDENAGMAYIEQNT